MGINRFVQNLPDRGVRRSLENAYEPREYGLCISNFLNVTVFEREGVDRGIRQRLVSFSYTDRKGVGQFRELNVNQDTFDGSSQAEVHNG
ncbi:hypothetical protein E2L06_11485 [Haloterrigena sp. H1]|uniref:hypothetical protein n=1 Tax=Haloterrigena sp. H1 TaxID=2552943 RepID=UPI00110ED085|nr:hypothetical protein [Haloterrigena sp. H1]TMT87170.1 hypothetical protein E2L06_11485 [Haloterrigena sp. H1]